MHSMHFCGSITNVPFASEIATFGHSGSHAEQLVHYDATIFKAIGGSCYRRCRQWQSRRCRSHFLRQNLAAGADFGVAA